MAGHPALHRHSVHAPRAEHRVRRLLHGRHRGGRRGVRDQAGHRRRHVHGGRGFSPRAIHVAHRRNRRRQRRRLQHNCWLRRVQRPVRHRHVRVRGARAGGADLVAALPRLLVLRLRARAACDLRVQRADRLPRGGHPLLRLHPVLRRHVVQRDAGGRDQGGGQGGAEGELQHQQDQPDQAEPGGARGEVRHPEGGGANQRRLPANHGKQDRQDRQLRQVRGREARRAQQHPDGPGANTGGARGPRRRGRRPGGQGGG
mmetsp:Transcript_5148/g.14523  ORF Transcript_5148/g.14523 Transcript_5148/m.14523 type:complete len:258 (-) Transcript_5148:716-1489(-)